MLQLNQKNKNKKGKTRKKKCTASFNTIQTGTKCVWSHCQISMAKIRQYFTLFLWRKFGNASSQMQHNTQNAIFTKFLTWEYGNGDAPFSQRKFDRVLRLVRYGTPAGFCVCVYNANRHAHTMTSRSLPSVKHVDACHIHKETNVTWWHGSRQLHHDDHAHNIAWVCTYGIHLQCIPTLQGQELSWLERVTHIATRVHHTKCTITHTYIYTHTHTSCAMQPHKAGK